jgi:hypothetical protein
VTKEKLNYTDLISVPDDKQPCVVTITGDAGVGKTRLAATWPKPIFIRAEDGMKSIPKDKRPPAFPALGGVDDLWEQLKWLLREEHDFKTLVIDSVTQLETMFAEYIVANDDKGATSLATACGGYGAGYRALGAMHGRQRQAAKLLMERKGMHIVFIAHSDIAKIDPPDGDPYSRYELRLHKLSETHYVDNVDMVAYLRLETFLKGSRDDKLKKAVSDGTRIAICHSGPSQVSKNRFGIDEPVTLEKDVNPFPFIN